LNDEQISFFAGAIQELQEVGLGRRSNPPVLTDEKLPAGPFATVS